MTTKRLLSVYSLLGVVILAFALSMIFSVSNLRKYEELAQTELTDTTWILAQAEVELIRFIYALDLYMYGDPQEVTKEDVVEHMEIFWSRLPLFLEGREGRRIARIGYAQETARAALQTLERLEPAITGLKRSDKDGYRKLRAELHGLLNPMRRTLADFRQWQEAATGIRTERQDRIYAEIIVAFIGIVVSSACLVLLLLHEIRLANRARTAEHRASTRLSEAIESFSDGFSLLDKDNRLVLFNRRYREMHAAIGDLLAPGVPFEDLIRARVERGLVPDAVGREEEWIQERLRRNRSPQSDFEIRQHDDRWYRVSERRTRDGGCVSIRSDITSLKKRQHDLADQQQRADSANRAKTDFLLTMSHELRTPLNAIMGFSEVMKQQMCGPLGSERYAGYAADIHQSARHLLAVINNILDISRIEAGRLDLDEQAVAIADEVEKALRLLEDEASEANIRLIRSIDTGLPLLLGDPHKIQQIVINLAGNAIRYMPAGRRVIISAKRDGKGGIVLSVEDNGPGMTAEEVERVISPFVRLSNPMVRQKDGTGLGLPLVKALVELHGGTFELKSRPGIGTIALAHFPRGRVLSEGRLMAGGSAAGPA